ncbi:MAG: hypothetical protein Kow006_00440 [Gammaproteobacteria bacterium]
MIRRTRSISPCNSRRRVDGNSRAVLTVGLLLFSLSLTPHQLQACGWWGDGESDTDGEAVTVGVGDKPLNGIDEASGPEAMTRDANRLRGYGPAGYAGALRLYRQAAQAGYAPAMNNLGAMYEEGLGVARDLAQALSWYRRAAELGEPHAQHSFAMMLIEGRGIERDVGAGLRWLEQAARLGHASACADLGRFYAAGRHVDKDLEKAIHWWREAERLGYPTAGEVLATLSITRQRSASGSGR